MIAGAQDPDPPGLGFIWGWHTTKAQGWKRAGQMKNKVRHWSDDMHLLLILSFLSLKRWHWIWLSYNFLEWSIHSFARLDISRSLNLSLCRWPQGLGIWALAAAAWARDETWDELLALLRIGTTAKWSTPWSVLATSTICSSVVVFWGLVFGVGKQSDVCGSKQDPSPRPPIHVGSEAGWNNAKLP